MAGIGPVDLVQVDPVGTQATQTALHRFPDAFPGQVVGRDLGGDQRFVAAA